MFYSFNLNLRFCNLQINTPFSYGIISNNFDLLLSDILLVKNPKPCEASENLITGFNFIMILNMIAVSIVILVVVKLNGKVKIE